MEWKLVGTKNLTVKVVPPTILPPILNWAVEILKNIIKAGENLPIKIKVETGDGNVPLPLKWTIDAFGVTYESSEVKQNPNTTKEYVSTIKAPDNVSPGTYTISVSLYKGE